MTDFYQGHRIESPVKFADLPVYRWRRTKAGEVKLVADPALPLLTMVFDCQGKLIGNVHRECVGELFEEIVDYQPERPL